MPLPNPLQWLKGRRLRDRLMGALMPATGRPWSGRLLLLDFPARPRMRQGGDLPPHPQLHKAFVAQQPRFRAHLESFLPLRGIMEKIPLTGAAPGEPMWLNTWFQGFDAVALYGFIANRRPRRYIEIGSGTSTLFARRAIRDHGLDTRIISIDPAPRAEVDAQCDEVLRMALEDVPMEFFDSVTAEDVIFFDGSHRALQNSDVTVFFTEILPRLPAGTLVGVHDIFLPYDYPPEIYERWYSEQYMLAAWLLAGERLRVELPLAHCMAEAELDDVLNPYWESRALAGVSRKGYAFWFSMA